MLDIAEPALRQSKARLGKCAVKAKWIVANITQWMAPRTWDIWHDRAVFHFLTEPAQQDAYIAALIAGTKAGATVVMATIALEGSQKCSGLPVHRYSPQTLAMRLGASFVLVDEAQEVHTTPWGTVQKFSYAVFRLAA